MGWNPTEEEIVITIEGKNSPISLRFGRMGLLPADQVTGIKLGTLRTTLRNFKRRLDSEDHFRKHGSILK